MVRGEEYLETPRGRLTRVGGWTLGETLGRGTYAHVRLATHTVSGRKAACKILPCLYVPGFPPPSHNEVVDAEEAHKELVILKALSGCKIPGVVELEGVLEEGGWHYIFLSLQPASLSTFAGRMNESQICLFFAKLLRTVEALHHLHISHEDIKRANVLVSPDTRTKGLVYPVLADFGFSHFNPSGGFVTSLGGTFDYSSPQKIAEQAYDPYGNDIWSMGILFLKMIGYPHPYLGSEERYAMGKRQAKDRITLGDPRWNWRTTNLRPSSLGSFVMRMLERDEENRHTASELLEHPYLLKRVKDMPPKITIPPSRLPSKVARPLLPAVLQDVLFLSYQVGEFRLCETSRNIEKKIYGRQPCWEQLYATMLSKWEKKADLEWEDLIPATAAKRALAKSTSNCRSASRLQQIHLSPVPPKSPLVNRHENDKENVPPCAGPTTPRKDSRIPVAAKRPKTFGFGRVQVPCTPLKKKTSNSVSDLTALAATSVQGQYSAPTAVAKPSRQRAPPPAPRTRRKLGPKSSVDDLGLGGLTTAYDEKM